jgi:hypothetical protein
MRGIVVDAFGDGERHRRRSYRSGRRNDEQRSCRDERASELLILVIVPRFVCGGPSPKARCVEAIAARVFPLTSGGWLSKPSTSLRTLKLRRS